MSSAHILTQMQDLLSDPVRWTKGELARDENGQWCPPLAASAKCWCMLGAYRRVTGTPEAIIIDLEVNPVTKLIRESIVANSPVDGIVNTNDTTDHATVMKVIGGGAR